MAPTGATAQIGFEYVMNHSLTYEEAMLGRERSEGQSLKGCPTWIYPGGSAEQVVGYKSFWGKSQECSLKFLGDSRF